MKGICRYDLIEGFREIRIKLLIFLGFVIYINYTAAGRIKIIADSAGCKYSFCDFVACVIGGPKLLLKGNISGYELPVMWLTIYVLIAYAVGAYATSDMKGYGQHILMRSEKRNNWWIGKCIWNTAVVAVMMIMLYAITFINALISNADICGELTSEIMASILSVNISGADTTKIKIVLFVMPFLVTISLSMLQMVIELVIVPIAGFFISQSIVMLATMSVNPVLFANYGILSHYDMICHNMGGSNIYLMYGIPVCFGIYIFSIVIGILYFSRCDIY